MVKRALLSSLIALLALSGATPAQERSAPGGRGPVLELQDRARLRIRRLVRDRIEDRRDRREDRRDRIEDWLDRRRHGGHRDRLEDRRDRREDRLDRREDRRERLRGALRRRACEKRSV